MVDELTAAQAAERIAELEAALKKCVAHAEGIETALQSRDVIGQAKGIIQVRERCGPDEAFERLRDLSQHRNIKLRDLARAVVESPDDILGG